MRPLRDFVDAEEQPGVDEPTWEPEAAGFPLVVSGLTAFLLGLLAALWAQQAPGLAKYAWREVAGVTIGVALPLFLLGIFVAFPTRRGSRVAAMAGLGLAIAGIAVFIDLYPYHWNVQGRDGSPWGLVPYGSGILLMGSAAFMSLLDAFLDVRAGNPVGTRARESEEPVTAEEIARDLADASARSKLTWGGIESMRGPKLRVSVEPSATVLKGRIGQRFFLDDVPVTPDVARLQAFRGTTVTATEAVDDAPASALVALRRAKEEEARVAEESRLLNRMMTHMRTFFSPWETGHEDAPRERESGPLVTFTIVDATPLEVVAKDATPLIPALEALAHVKDFTASEAGTEDTPDGPPPHRP